MSVRSIEDWSGILKPLGYWDAADVILDDLVDYPKKGGELRRLLNAHREEDKKQLGNALIAWAMLTAIEIEASWVGGHQNKSTRQGTAICWSRRLGNYKPPPAIHK
jgi:hypothetical protein